MIFRNLSIKTIKFEHKIESVWFDFEHWTSTTLIKIKSTVVNIVDKAEKG